MEKRLLLKDSKGELIAELLSFTYNAKRMGGAPTISATLHSFVELTLTTDDYVEFNGEKYYIKHTPTSSKGNTDARYKYDLEFVSERIMLDDIYFYDTTHSTDTVSKSIAKSADFLFSGTIYDLADKINSSLEVSKIGGYVVVIGEDIIFSEYKQIKFSNTFISNAIQEFYNTFEVPYYFEWDATLNKTLVHVTSGIAKSPNVAFEYGKDNALLSITKTNANYKIVNRATGVGSSENIPYYYPNESASGKHTLDASPELGEVKVNYDVLSKHANVADGETLVYHLKKTDIEYPTSISYDNQYGVAKNKNNATSFVDTVGGKVVSRGRWHMDSVVRVNFSELAGAEYTIYLGYAFSVVGSDTATSIIKVLQPEVSLSWGEATLLSDHEVHLKFSGHTSGIHTHYLWIDFDIEIDTEQSYGSLPLNLSFSFYRIAEGEEGDYFELSDGSSLLVAKSGIKVETPSEGGVISISKMLNWIEPQKTLMPSIYRGTLGQERFYNAINGEVKVPFIDSDNANTDPDEYRYSFPEDTFVNPFNEGRPKEHIVTIDDIKPSIVGVEVNGERIDMFSAFAYDENDNNELDEENHYKHPYFYAKLKKLGFNLFDHANENGEMTISFTSGDCSACNFIIGVDGEEDTQKNTVQVDENGDLLRDANGDVRSGREGKPKEKAQERQQDTINNEVWIALKKEDSTFGTLYPNATEKPSIEDTFVITNINLPLEYILAAEKRLEERIKQYLIDNNNEKFNFSIKFSRIYLADEKNKDVRDQITENSSIKVIYQGREATLYVSSYTYKMTAGEALPEISVELSDTLSVSNGVMRNVINQVKAEVMTSVANVDIVAQGARAFVRKDQNDQTVYRLTANEMDVVKDSNIGGSLDVGGSSSIGGELTVGRKAGFSDDVNVGGDINVGEYTEILGEISGAKISQDGSAVFKSVRVNALETFTMIYNKIRATSAYTAFDDSGTIVDIVEIEGGKYKITFDRNENSYSHPFKSGDILWGVVNKLNDFAYSIYGRCWMWVSNAELENEPWSLEATLFENEDCPDGENIIPTANMVVMHRGNINYDNKERQRTFFISAKDGSIIQLLDVTSPKLFTLMSSDNPKNYSNYGVVIGKLPKDLFDYIQNRYEYISEEDPIVYAKYLAVQNLLQIDYAGRPIRQEIYRGEWSYNIATSDEPYQSTPTSYDTATHNGSLWQCMAGGTTAEPREGIAEWHKKVSKGDDSTAVVYQLKPSANVVYYRTAENKLSVDNLEVVVGVTDNDGYYDIADQYTLEQRGLAVYYAVDGEGEPTLLNISPDGQFVLEDGSGLIIAETGNELLLEGDSLDISAIKDNITLYLKDIETNDDRATYIIPVIKDGEEGKQGRMLYPAGVFDAEKEYKIENNSAPFVKEGDTYYVWVWEGDAKSGIVPSQDKEGIYWRPFTYMNYLFAEFLMAKWARFGGDNGGVFYEKWLFSQDGVTSEGQEKHYSEYKGNIFDKDGELGEGYTPNLAIDFKTGAVMMNNLTERYRRYQNVGIVKMEKYHNIIVQPESGVSPMLENPVQGFSGPLVILPQKESKLARNGSAVSIFADMGDTFRLFAEKEKSKNIPLSGLYKIYSTFSLICADDIIGDESEPGYAKEPGGTGQYDGNWIICHGCRSKWLVLGAGDMVSMRLVISGETRYWVVTNSSDIATIEGDIYLNKDLHWKTDEIVSSVTFKESVFNEATGYYEGFDQIAFTNASAQNENWNNVGTHTDAKYIRMLFASKNFISKYAYVYMGYNFPHIILSTHKDGWWSDEGNNYHYRLLDKALDDKNFPLTKEQ